MRGEDLTGKTYGRLTVLGEAERKSGRRYWLCRCECGTERAIQAWHLTSGTTRSCGCYQREVRRMESQSLSAYLKGARARISNG